MKTPFPIFVDLETVPPLVIGTAENLVAKIRLLLKFAPVVDVITDGAALPHLYQMPNVCRIVDMSYDAPKAQLEAHIKGRPLIIVETLDDKRDAALSAIARGYGVPVNIPDTPALCSFYLGSIVDRAPVTVAISTSGMAPVLGQNLRAKIEDMLPSSYGELAVYLHRLRKRLRHLPAAVRRQIQHRLIDSPIANDIVNCRYDHADGALLSLIRQAMGGRRKAGSIQIIELPKTDIGAVPPEAAAAIRGADSLFHDDNTAPHLIEMARREVRLVTLRRPFALGGEMVALVDALIMATLDGREVAQITSQDTAGLVSALGARGYAATRIIVAASPAKAPIRIRPQIKTQNLAGQGAPIIPFQRPEVRVI